MPNYIDIFILKGWTRERISFRASVLALCFGCLSLFTNNWFVGKGGLWKAGFINICSPLGCITYQDGISMIQRFGVIETDVGDKLKTYYVLCVIGIIYLPLMWTFGSVVLKAFNLINRPSNKFDYYASMFIWWTVYHGTWLMIMFVIISVISDKLKEMLISKAVDNNDGYMNPMYQNRLNKLSQVGYHFGWSAYVGLIALIIVLVAAMTGMPKEKSPNLNNTTSDDSVLLETVERV